ncbi:M60 family metallopeptidase, partial [Rubripirellula amarantea]|nr:M60 family metallopeptidase [Rubripirellula amarantea]
MQPNRRSKSPNPSQHRITRKRRASFEKLESRELLAADIPAYFGDGQIGEAGTVQIDHNWSTVNLGQTFNNPVVIAGPASSVNGSPLTARVRNVDADSFEIALDEWDYLDGGHSIESVSYLVVEGGYHLLTDGTRLVAGYLQDQDHSWESISTVDFFNTTPVLLSQIMTENDASAATTRTRILSNNEFEVRIQEEEAADDIHGAETVGFVALETSIGTTGDQNYQSFATSNGVTHTGTTLSFSFDAGFSSTPAFLASMQTFNGGDTASVRYTSLDNDSISFLVEEEQSADTELSHGSGEIVGGLAIEAGGIFADSSFPEPSDRFIELEEHILGIDTMTVSELESWTTAFLSNGAAGLGTRPDDFVAAVELVERYEDAVGPLFTPEGQESFAASWDGETSVSRGLARAMLSVYQAISDSFDSSLVANYPNLVDGLMFRSTEYFPGSVPYPTDQAAIYQVQIDGSLADEFGSDGGYNTNAARRMTGAYLAPGTIAEVIVPQELVDAGYVVRVGGHSWDLSNKNTVNRLYRVSNTFDITSTVTQVANPMGGNIYIDVPVGADAGLVDIQFRNVIRAPFFSDRSFDQTTQSEWENVERHHPGAFTDIESEHSMWTVPTKWIDNLGYDDLIGIIEAHDANIQVASEYMGKNADRHKAILYMIVDTQIRGNAFSIGYPQSNYGSFNQNTIRDPLTLGNAFNKVLWHEHGHAELVTMFAGEAESHVHMLAVAIGMENYGMTPQEAFSESLAYGSTNHDTSDALNSWVVMDEFLDGQNMAYQQGSYRPRGHADYVEYVEMFGLEAMQNFNRRINIEMDGLDWDEWGNGRTSHNNNDRILRLSREAGVNVAPLFHLWGHAPSNASQLASAMATEGLGASAQIYDRMIEARDSVPLNQAEWNAVDSVMEDFLNNARGPWEELRANYDVARGQAAVTRIQELIDLYFSSGRPAESPAPEPLPPTVVAYADANFGGTSWAMAEGTYINTDLNAGP